MAIHVIETISVIGSGGSADSYSNVIGSIILKVDTTTEKIIKENNYPTGETVSGYGSRIRPVGEEFPSSPFFSQAGNKLTVTVAPDPVFAEIKSAPVVCDIVINDVSVSPATREANGQISVTATGTNGAKEYSINDGVTWQKSHNFYNLTPGEYTVLVADAARNCTAEKTVTVSNKIVRPDDLSIDDIIVEDETEEYKGGSILIAASGSNTPFSYELVYPNGKSWKKTTSDFNNVAAGTYTVRVTDNTGSFVERKNIIIKSAGVGGGDPIVPQTIFESKTVEVRDCPDDKGFFISWLNLLGGVSCWLFQRVESRKMEVSDIQTFKRGYSDLSQMRGNVSINSLIGREIVTVYAEGEPNSRIQSIARSLLSKKIYWYRSKQDWKDRIELIPVGGTVDTSGHKIELTFALPEYYT